MLSPKRSDNSPPLLSRKRKTRGRQRRRRGPAAPHARSCLQRCWRCNAESLQLQPKPPNNNNNRHFTGRSRGADKSRPATPHASRRLTTPSRASPKKEKRSKGRIPRRNRSFSGETETSLKRLVCLGERRKLGGGLVRAGELRLQTKKLQSSALYAKPGTAACRGKGETRETLRQLASAASWPTDDERFAAAGRNGSSLPAADLQATIILFKFANSSKC